MIPVCNGKIFSSNPKATLSSICKKSITDKTEITIEIPTKLLLAILDTCISSLPTKLRLPLNYLTCK